MPLSVLFKLSNLHCKKHSLEPGEPGQTVIPTSSGTAFPSALASCVYLGHAGAQVISLGQVRIHVGRSVLCHPLLAILAK